MLNFFKEDTKESTTRLVLVLGTLAVCSLFFGMVYHIIKYENVRWEGLSILTVSVSGYMGTLLYGKVQQKKVENKPKDKSKDSLEK